MKIQTWKSVEPQVTTPFENPDFVLSKNPQMVYL